jgi:8-oxo-dGTP pyrophosphatase MutT (NUDIX family)
MEKLIFSAGVLLIRDKKVLLVKHLDGSDHISGTYGLPAGRIVAGESAIETAERELKEETGIIAIKNGLIEYPCNEYFGMLKRKGGKEKLISIKIFILTKYSGEIKASQETEPEWINLKQLDKINLLPNVFKIMQDGLEFLKNKQ